MDTETLLESYLHNQPVDWFVICGSGLGTGLVAPGGIDIQIHQSIPLKELGLPVPAVAGHGQSLVYGRVGTQHVCIQTGRLHPYEGYPIDVCTAVLAALLSKGVRGVVLTCAAGALDPTLSVGQIVLLRDQIALFGPTPLVGPQFADCGAIYHPGLRARVQSWIKETSPEARLAEVVYAHTRGPQYETPAETEALRRLGGDIVGMSTTYEAILASARGAKVCGLGIVTNVAGKSGLTHQEVQQYSDAAKGRLSGLLSQLLSTSPDESTN